MISRTEALMLIKKYLRDRDNIRSAVAVEAILRKIAKTLSRDEDLWGLTGLLHNIDYEYCSGNPEKRGYFASMLLEGLLPEKGVNAIKANNYMHTEYIPTSSLDKALIAGITTAGLLIEIAKDIPSKKISDVELSMVISKFSDNNYKSRYKRSRIKVCADIGLELEFFLKLSLDALKSKSELLGL